MRYTLAVLLVCALVLGTTSRRASASGVEGAAHQLPRIIEDVTLPGGFDPVPEVQVADWQQLATGNVTCPTVQELNATRQRLAIEALTAPNPTEAYRQAVVRHLRATTAYARAHPDWVLCILRQTPEGRAYLARTTMQDLRWQLQFEGPAYLVIDAGGGPAMGSFFAAPVQDPDPMAAFYLGPYLQLVAGFLTLGVAGITMAVAAGYISAATAALLISALSASIGGLMILDAQGALAVQRARERDPER
ncbi:MAG: hypothetical protein ACRDFW_09020 [bacterium]